MRVGTRADLYKNGHKRFRNVFLTSDFEHGPSDLFLLLSLQPLELFYQIKLKFGRNPAGELKGYVFLCKRPAIFPVFRNKPNGISEFNPARRTHCKRVFARFRQKGVEFDPFEIRVVELFLYSQILQGIAKTHPVFDDILRFNGIPLSRDVGKTDIVFSICPEHSN